MNEVETNVVEEMMDVQMGELQLKRFWAKVQKGDECWEWTSSLNNQGYGTIGIHWKHHLAHRVSFMVANGPFPKRLKVLHKCDNPKCVRPDHLFLGTMKDNTKDCEQKDRNCRGSRSHKAKVSEEDVLRMRALYHAGTPMRTLVAEFGLTQATISVALRGLKWKHVGGPIAPTLPRKGRNAKITDEMKEDILNRIARREFLSEIAALYGVSVSCIMKIKRESGRFVLRVLNRRTHEDYSI